MPGQPDSFETLDREVDARLEASLEELGRFVAQPSIAAQNIGMDACASMAAEMLRARGFQVEFPSLPGYPVIVAERAGASDRTLLIYNHYDVQPPEPLELWTSPPFTATRRGDRLVGRGISDDKGHLTARLLAVDALLAARGELPCRVLWVLEGEEEIGSPNLPALVKEQKRRLQADACVWEFGYVDKDGVPVLHAGLRGICYVELSVETAARDAHSGVGGSIFPNAAWRLTWALASLKGSDERIRIPGHYDSVRPPSARDRDLLASAPDVAEEYRELYGVKGFLRSLDGLDLRVAEVFEPTCTICGLSSGYQGGGSKTVLPAQASAKVDFRLVPDQTPAGVLKGLRAHLDREGFPDVAIRFLGGNPAGRTDPDHPFLRLASETARPVFGAPMRIVPMVGGSGPNESFIRELQVPITTAGFGYPDTRAHAPDENLLIPLYRKHAKHAARLIAAFAGKASA